MNEDFGATSNRAARGRALLSGIAWLTVCPLLLLLGLRVVAHDATQLLIAINAFTSWLYLPAWPCLAFALLVRRRALSVCAGMVVGGHILLLDPSAQLGGEVPDWAARGERLRVMSSNLLLVNQDQAGITQEILDARPDVLLVQELTPAWEARFARADMSTLFPHRTAFARDDAFGIGLYSRLPLRVKSFDLLGVPALRAELQVGGAKLTVYNVHTLPPRTHAYAERWNRMMSEMHRRLLGENGALLVGGDLNATPHTRWYQTLVSSTLRGAHEDRGRGFATTWPNGRMPYPPIRLDHLLISKEVAVLQVREGEGRGSDHRPVIADLVLRQE